MVGIVIVSHSEKLADGVKELAQQMSQNKVKIFAAGGIDDESNPIGTDPFKIKEAIELADSKEGILVLMDIGSAVMNAELASEMLSDDLKEKVLLCEAPLTEGAIAAAAQAMTGADLKTVANEARNGLMGKKSLLGSDGEEQKPKQIAQVVGKEIEIKVPNELGLHARPAVRLVELVNKYNNEVSVSKNKRDYVSAGSISQVGTLGAKKDDVLTFKVIGEEFLEFEKSLQEFYANNFGDSKKEIKSKKPVQVKTNGANVSSENIQGVPVSKGISVGPAKVLHNQTVIVEKTIINNTTEEKIKLKSALSKVVEELEDIRHKTMGLYGKEDAEIFDFHVSLLKDDEKINEIENLIEDENYSAAYAWFYVFEKLELKYLEMNNQYFKERASDVIEVRNKVLVQILDCVENEINLTEPSILIVEEIGPAQTLSLDTDKVLGIVSKVGGETSHATILARSLGIPAITGLENQVDVIVDGELIGIDGSKGVIYLDRKNPEKIASLREEKKIEEKIFQERFSRAKMPAITEDEVKFKILANISSPKEAKIAFENGADGIGLYRTEFLYMNRETPPSEEEQYEIYKQVCENMQGLPITIRSLDVGGDKPIPYLGIGEETNPFLGVRGIRYCLQNKEIFKTQLRAICRVSADYEIRIMYPMVGMLEEVIEANSILAEVQDELSKEGVEYSKHIKKGIMVEVPSILFILPQIAKELDFLSIGTNDLTQYLLAMDRENVSISKHYSALHPTVISALISIIQNSDKEGLEVSLCGELARNPKATNLLSSIGLRSYSMSSPAIPAIKEAIRKMNIKENKISLDDIYKWSTLSVVKSKLQL
ncbi:phosphoenolpyruvate--protein phosphotransferase [Aquimarina algicola]|uniref:Phosphoenolpyruvate-protein phosphotransferase n=1 Tax=Aquimarina algicola TaxID=2589995 RepID=A0A504JJY3_9FLAO|nr:phosphoenolpyruvate--protein phosphotransferase [Aquimarina algicola]TPN87059.1 phosphoenolpyruvate--protein phosphotransferase [Aquimarina algicola]